MEDHPQLVATLGWSGRMISGSKSGYHRAHPDHVAIFNAGICAKRDGPPELIWEGDLDLTLDEQHLVAFARASEQALYVVREGHRPDSFHGWREVAMPSWAVILVIDEEGCASFDERRIKRDPEGRLRLDLDKIEIESLSQEAALLRGRCERLDAIVLRGIEQGWASTEEREAALWFPDSPGAAA